MTYDSDSNDSTVYSDSDSNSLIGSDNSDDSHRVTLTKVKTVVA